MTRNEIIEMLTRLIAPLKMQAQPEPSNFDKFQDVLKQSLTQPSLEIRRTGMQFPDFQFFMLPEDIEEALEKMTDEIIMAQATRQPNDPVFWLCQRNISVHAGIEERLENYLEPEFSFGPFINQQSKQVWFDFYQVPEQLRFEIAEGGISDFLIITLPSGVPLPDAGKHHDIISFEDCTIWISVKTIALNADKKFIGIRAKKCEMSFTGLGAVQAGGFVSIFSPGFQLSFQPFDKFAKGIDQNISSKAIYPDLVALRFSGTKWSLETTKSVITINDNKIELAEGTNLNPQFLEPERLIHVPLSAKKDSWEILSNEAESFHLNGKSNVTDSGWYLPVVSTENALDIGVLGMLIFSGYLGFRGQEGLTLDWPGLENGKLAISKFLLLARPGRVNLKYSYTATLRIKQQITTWKSVSDGKDRSSVQIKPLPEGDGNCMVDNQQMEALFQPVGISAKADRPLNSSQQRFDISGHQGAMVFIKIEADTSVFVIGSHPPSLPDRESKRRIPQSLCLRNALLTVDNPVSIFLQGHFLSNEFLSEGICYLGFPVYRLINTLPDPYISNQDGIFDLAELERFNHLWRTGQDTLPDHFLFSVTANVQWKNDTITLDFNLNQSLVINRTDDSELLDRFREMGNLCGVFDNANGFHGEDIEKIKAFDSENVIGSFGYLQWLPGNRLLVDVSGSANHWGVSFSTHIVEDQKLLAENLGFPASFPFRIKSMDLVSSGRMSRLFTLPHIQWEPVMKIENPLVAEGEVASIIMFQNNGNPTRISTARKAEVVLAPRQLYAFIQEGFNSAEKPFGMAANFSLPFGICALAYFNPKPVPDLPSALATLNEPAFSGKKTGELRGGMQLHLEAVPPEGAQKTDNHLTYFIGLARQLQDPNQPLTNILGTTIQNQFNNEFSKGGTAKVPLERIDFAGYGASIFSNWLNESANFGAVSQVKFDVLIGRTAHEVIQIKSILFPWGVPVVRSIVIQRKNTGIITRYDSGWVAQGPGVFNFLSHTSAITEENPYHFHPGMVKGIFNVREIKDLPAEMDIPIPSNGTTIKFSGVYFNGDVEIENIIKGGVPKTDGDHRMVHSVGQLGYVMLADPSIFGDATTLATLFPPNLFKTLLNDAKIGGSLGGPVNAIINIGGTGQKMQATRVDVSPSKEANVTFVVAVRGTIELPKEGSWMVVKCLPSKDVIALNPAEAVPIIRNGLLNFKRTGTTVTKIEPPELSNHCLGDPAEIDKYAPGAAAPSLQYSLLQTTGTQKLLFRRPSFAKGKPNIITEIPDLADAFRLLKCNTIFPNLSQTLSLPDNVQSLNITGEGSGLKFDESLFEGPVNLNNFVPPQLKEVIPESLSYQLLDESGFKVFVKYRSKEEKPSVFQVDLSSEAVDEAADNERKKWQTINKDVAVEVHLGSLQPLLTLSGEFRAEAGKEPTFENPKSELGGDLEKVKDILQILALLAGEADKIADSLKVVMSNSPDAWNYKMSIDQNIPVIQFPDTAFITLSTPPPLIIEASLSLGIFFNLSLSPDPNNLVKPGAGAVFGFEGMIQIQLITIEIAAAYGVGITKVKAYVDLVDPKPQFEFTFGFGATVIVDLPVVGLVSVTRSFSLTGDISAGKLLVVAGQMLRGTLSLAGGLLMVTIQIEGSAGVERKEADPNNKSTVALFKMIFSLDVSLAFVVSYDFSKPYTEKITLS